MEDEDGLYDSLPEMCDIPLALTKETTNSSQVNEANSVHTALSSESLKNSDESNGDKKQTSETECHCRDSVHWVWENNSRCAFVKLMKDNMVVRFHKRQSKGTAVVRCTEPMSDDQYFWEVKMTYPVYGTDIMVGVGTSEVEVRDFRDRFMSLLGKDSKTWGFSYTGLFHHNGRRQCYATSFGQGSVIGVHLDLWRGTLSFYKDRKHLGVASTGLQGKTLYAMACSTAARSGMSLIRTATFPSSLQFMCCAKLREVIPDDKNVLDVIDVPPGLKHYLQTKLSWLLCARNLEEDPHICTLTDTTNDDDDDVSDDSSTDSDDLMDYSITGQFFLLGSALMSNLTRHHRALRNFRRGSRGGAGGSGERQTKRRRRF